MTAKPIFRLLRDPPGEGAWNMALDEALLHSAATTGVGTVRVYSWREPTLSLGYFQPLASREEHAASRPCAIVRRSTGGGAILHDCDLTYSIAVPVAARWSPTADAWYATAHEAWVSVLSELGLPASRVEAKDRLAIEEEPFLCFQRRSPGDVVVGECKIVGSAQRRSQGGLLQHGSVLLGRSRHAPELAGLRELTGREIPPEEAAHRWLLQLRVRLNCKWEDDAPSAAELAAAAEIRANKFGNDSWLKKR